jgi:hypothetical protein
MTSFNGQARQNRDARVVASLVHAKLVFGLDHHDGHCSLSAPSKNVTVATKVKGYVDVVKAYESLM